MSFACRYVDYLLEAVGKRELFALLRLEPEKWWHGLLFRDRYNMLGIAASIPQAVQDSLSQHPGALTQVCLISALTARVLTCQQPGVLAEVNCVAVPMVKFQTNQHPEARTHVATY